MGKRLSRTQLLDAIREERAALDAALAGLSARQMTKPGVTRGGWSAKDVLAHLAAWQQMVLDWYETGLRGEKVHLPAPGYTLRDLPRLNQAIYQKHHRRSVRSIVDEFNGLHARLVKLVASRSDTELTTLRYYAWTGPSWTLSDYLRAGTAAHYHWATVRITRWKRHLSAGPGAGRQH